MTAPSATTTVDEILARASQAAAVFSQFDQAQTDRVVDAVARAAFGQRVALARLAAEETGIGKWQDKVLKNVVASQLVYEHIRDQQTVGILRDDRARGLVEIAQPMGPILAVIPVTNPTSTVIFKTLISLKARNPIIICPSRNALQCSTAAAKLCYEAALAADAPEDCVQWVTEVTREQTQALMRHPKVALILATGGPSLVQAAYSSGTPTLGVGAGNVPVFIERSADLPFAAEQVRLSKTFDNGTICASEQAIVVEQASAAGVEAAFRAIGAYFCTPEEVKRLEPVVMDPAKGSMNAAIVGKPAAYIAERAGLTVPANVQLLLAPLAGVGKQYPLSGEVLAPVLAYYVAPDFNAAANLCIDLNFYGGIGHTASIYSNDRERIMQFASLMNAGRIVVNTPSAQGGVGGLYNLLTPSLTLGCGTGGKNITTDNVSVTHLLNIQRVAFRRDNARFQRFDQAQYLDESLDLDTILARYNRNY